MEAVSKQTRRELITALRERYRLSPKAAKGRILDEFFGVSGFHRKHAVRLLAMNSKSVSVSPSVGQCIYDEATRQALILVWEAADRICGKRLKAIIPDLLTAMEKHGHLKLEGEVRRRVESASAATIDRLLRSVRKSAGSRRRKRPGKKMTREIPVKTCHDWHDPQPGFLEIDFVVHSGGSMAGEYLHSLVATDVCSGWTEAIPLIAREQSLVVEGLRRIGGRAVAAHRNGSGSAHRNGAVEWEDPEREISFPRRSFTRFRVGSGVSRSGIPSGSSRAAKPAEGSGRRGVRARGGVGRSSPCGKGAGGGSRDGGTSCTGPWTRPWDRGQSRSRVGAVGR